MSAPRLLLCAPASGGGKTTVTCALLQALVNRGAGPVAFKCGPDYIDPMFHSEIIGAKSRNLDLFFLGRDTARYLLEKNSRGSGLALIEGVMGYYDGIGLSADASAYDLARATGTPAVLVLDEPVDGLDPVMRRQVWSLLMGDVAQRGTTVLVSSHNLRELEDVCDHVGILSRGKVLIERSLSALQENVVKMQVVFQEKELPQLPGDLQVLHVSQVGRIHTLIIRGNATEITNRLAAFAPILMEALPLTLEEIFIYELGGEDYAVRDIVL